MRTGNLGRRPIIKRPTLAETFNCASLRVRDYSRDIVRDGKAHTRESSRAVAFFFSTPCRYNGSSALSARVKRAGLMIIRCARARFIRTASFEINDSRQ